MGAQYFPLPNFLICALKNYRRLEKKRQERHKNEDFYKKRSATKHLATSKAKREWLP